jgi:hypothetical protein
VGNHTGRIILSNQPVAALISWAENTSRLSVFMGLLLKSWDKKDPINLHEKITSICAVCQNIFYL